MSKRQPRQPEEDPLPDDTRRRKDELLEELKALRRQYVNLKILEEEHDKALAALQESEDRYRQIFETANDIIYRTDEMGYFLYANPAAVRIIGYPLNEIIGKNYLELIRPDYRMRVMRHYSMQRLEKIPSTYLEFPVIAKDGREVWLGQNVQIVQQGNAIIEMQCLARDMTDIKKAEQERQQLEGQLRQAQKMESVGRLAGGIAHDFNNILGIVLAYTNILERGDLSRESVKTSLEAINRAVDRAKGMIKHLLTFAQKSEPTFQYVDVNNSIREFTKMIVETFPSSIAYEIDLSDDVGGIDADSNQFHQLLLNLYVNARDAMPDGGTLSVRSEIVQAAALHQQYPMAKNAPYVAISVRDTGVGMDEATQSRIFEPFFSTKEHGKGSGLGLSVVYGIVQSHRGFVDVKSNVGEGSTFTVFLPPAESTRLEKVGASKEGETEDLRGSETILFVEDEDVLRDVMTNILKENGYNVLVAGDGIEAVETFMRYHREIKVVLSDLGLPKLGGWEACATMREINPRIPFILASGFIEPERKSEMEKGGAKAFVEKPYEPAEILRGIRNVLKEYGTS